MASDWNTKPESSSNAELNFSASNDIDDYYGVPVSQIPHQEEDENDENGATSSTPHITVSSEAPEEPVTVKEAEDSEIGMFVRSRSLRMYNFTMDDLANKRFLNIMKRAPQVHIDISAPATELRLRYVTPQDAQDAFRHLQDCKYGRPVRIVYDRDRLSCVVDWTLALDPGTRKPATDSEEKEENEKQQELSTWMAPLSRRTVVIQNIPPTLNDRQLSQYFPNIIGCWIATDSYKSSKGYAYLEYRDEKQASECVTKYASGIQIGHTVMTVHPVCPMNVPAGQGEVTVLPFQPTRTFFVKPNPRPRGAKRNRGGRYPAQSGLGRGAVTNFDQNGTNDRANKRRYDSGNNALHPPPMPDRQDSSPTFSPLPFPLPGGLPPIGLRPPPTSPFAFPPPPFPMFNAPPPPVTPTSVPPIRMDPYGSSYYGTAYVPPASALLDDEPDTSNT